MNDPKVPASGEESTRAAQALTFDIIKGNLFRGIHADGAWGGLTPQGLMAVTFYTERFPIPKQISHVVRDGKVAEELLEARMTRENIVREAECCIYMSVKIAESLRDFLSGQIEQYKQIEVERSNKNAPKD